MKTKRLHLAMLIATLGLYTLLSFGLTLPYNYANTNIVLYTSILPEILSVLIELVEVILFAFGFSLLIYTSYLRYPLRSAIGLTGIFSAAALFRRLCDITVIVIVYGELGAYDLIEGVTYLLLDLLLIWVILGVIRLSASRYDRNLATKNPVSVLFTDDGLPEVDITAFYPFKKVYSKENPIQGCVLVIGGILSAVKVISRIIYDIEYGAPDGIGEILTMIVYYGSDLLIGLIFYVLSTLILGKLFRRIQ